MPKDIAEFPILNLLAKWRAAIDAGLPAEVIEEEVVTVTHVSDVHVFSIDDITGGFNGDTYADDPTIIDLDGTETVPTLTDKDGNVLSPIDSEFGFYTADFEAAVEKERDGDYAEGWAGNIEEEGKVVGLALVNAETDTFKSGQPFGTWAAGLGGNSVKASTEHYEVMAELLSDEEYPGDPDALYPLDNDLIIRGGEYDGQYVEDVLAIVGDVNEDGVEDVKDVLTANESTVSENIAYSSDYSVTLKDDGKLLYRWGTEVKRPNDIRLDVKLDLPDEFMNDADINDNGVADVEEINGGLGYKVTKAELVIVHDITNNPNDQVRPEDYENEGATGRGPSYYIVEDPNDPENILWVSPVDSYDGAGNFLPSYFAMTETGEIDMGAGGTAVYDPEGTLVGYRNTDGEGAEVGTVLRDMSRVALADDADLVFTSDDLENGYTNEWYTSTDRDPFQWSYDQYAEDPFKQVYVGFASSEEAAEAGYGEDELVSGPRWRLTSNKFGQDIPGVEIPLESNSQPPFTKDNIRYEVGETTTTTINLLDWEDLNGNGIADDSPLMYSSGWTTIDPTRLDLDEDGLIDEGWLEVNGTLGAGDALPEGPILTAVTPNGMTLTPEFLDTAVYLKGDRQDSAKIYDIQLILEFETDPSLFPVYDYGDAPDDGLTYEYQTFDGMTDARAMILEGFYLGDDAPDAESGAISDEYAQGDDQTGTDDEGTGITFFTQLAPNRLGLMNVETMIDTAEPTDGYLHAWVDLDGDGVFEEDEKIINGRAVDSGDNFLIFQTPDFDPADLADGTTYARFILSSEQNGVGAYMSEGDADYFGEVEDMKIDLNGVATIIDEVPAEEEVTLAAAALAVEAAPAPGEGGQDIDEPLNTDPTYTAKHVFSTDDITGTYDGLTQGDVAEGEVPVIDFSADPTVSKSGVNLYPINSEFSFTVTDFVGAEDEDFYANPEYEEGLAGDLLGEDGEQLGLLVASPETDVFATPALMGTWLVGMGGTAVKASTEHYVVMQHVLSDQKYPGDPDALYPLDDELYVVGGDYDGWLMTDAVADLGDANGDGVADIRDVLAPNENTITEAIAVSSDYSVTLKDDGKLLYRWGNEVKRPTDVRIEAEIPLPDEWSQPVDDETGLLPLYMVTEAELVVRHTISNNPNDQIRPEDYENEAASGTPPSYEVLPDGTWVSTDDFYAGDGTFYPAGTVLKDPAIVEGVEGGTLDTIGALSEDLEEGYTNAWYTTQDREPFEPVIEDGEYVVGPRWRLQSDKYGQDLPGVQIPIDPSAPPPPTKDDLKYEVGADTQTVINLLDWEGISPLSISAGWQHNSDTVTVNGVNLTQNFDVAIYIKGDQNPVTLYDAELVMSYEEVEIFAAGAAITGTDGDDILAGMGDNTMTGGAGEDLFVLSYGVTDNTLLVASTVADFDVGTDVLGLIGLDITPLDFDTTLTQTVVDGDLEVSLDGYLIATLTGVTEELGVESFMVLNPSAVPVVSEDIVGTEGDDVLFGDENDNTILGLGGNDILIGLEGADTLDGGDDTDTIRFDGSGPVAVDLDAGTGSGSDAEGDVYISIENVIGTLFGDDITGSDGANTLEGRFGRDTIKGGEGNDRLLGGGSADVFVFDENGWGKDVIADWTDGKDKISLDGTGLAFADFTEIETAQGVLLTHYNGSSLDTIFITGVTADLIDANDFLI